MEIKKNQSTTERFIRIILGGGLLLVATYVPMAAILVWLLLIFGVILMLTGLAGYCPIKALIQKLTKSK
ncbi:hypothetical protein A3K48_05695 [candidate division WOR-1 bacterium RIFOXYA12_FULL_52_29]|uniref:Inner membrane protein YgaP-like transmembrane domain-containing protein n=1 Tax=candidate division WOR-1 bacterium RIFOXYC12_FULL_54_18 TaxID=1802584 RepID=A0A1F4T6U7_UNCSA|nr:MAG: hypothetical protein A3K44_05695 [candidate division WOR-1 bacterium RIFOXYA2_FULL_51_19]OGC18028.1 MAG: hypothetical protein A3K48_05695 [candidate division WOR-1 bacterium RIFOXYA12_FULL_52_29]OGC26884.1 MAG: hypothetical protein A3K32_05690 [candidate division WOR-1 bacterium RIFOXYB2_FULL_45_9]OGC28445.1 MAG: hypothetical protein A3K49_05695 [candidate division WOR-1 bacterium RIFOXYC12_FULL_54_18]OGC31100.1 MAG: hypothetical protein A2346_06925 [candidate division WOR-1 bacterium R